MCNNIPGIENHSFKTIVEDIQVLRQPRHVEIEMCLVS